MAIRMTVSLECISVILAEVRRVLLTMIHQVSLKSRLFHCDSSAIYRSVDNKAGQLVKKKRDRSEGSGDFMGSGSLCFGYDASLARFPVKVWVTRER